LKEEDALRVVWRIRRICHGHRSQPFQGWPLHRAAGKPAIIIERRQHRPALVKSWTNTTNARARATKWIDVHALCVFSAAIRKKARCAIYTRKSSEEGLEQAFNSLDAQREACAAFILSQKRPRA
jgi:hypothetical protein